MIRKPSPSPLLSSALKPVLFKGCYHLGSTERSQQETVSTSLKDSTGDTSLLVKDYRDKLQFTKDIYSILTHRLFPNVFSISPVFYACPYVLLSYLWFFSYVRVTSNVDIQRWCITALMSSNPLFLSIKIIPFWFYNQWCTPCFGKLHLKYLYPTFV